MRIKRIRAHEVIGIYYNTNDVNLYMFRPTFVAIFWNVLYEGYIITKSKPMYQCKIYMTNVKRNVSTTLRFYPYPS